MYSIALGDCRLVIDASDWPNMIIEGSQPCPHFTRVEARLLLTLVRHQGTVRTPRMIFADIYAGVPDSDLPDQKILDVLVCKIRDKFARVGLPNPIATVWGRGYRMGEPATPVSYALIPFGLRNVQRWVTSKKEGVLELIREGLSREVIMSYLTDVSQEELDEWEFLYNRNGRRGLASTKSARLR